MRCGIVLALVGVTVLLGSCDKPPLAPDGDEGLTSVNAAVLSTSYNLTASATAPTAIALAWEDNSAHEDGFEIHRSTTGATGTFGHYATLGANATTFTDWGATPSTLSCYRVRAFRYVGRKTMFGDFSNIACAKTPALPPSNVNAIPVSSTEIRISWTDNGPTDDSFRVERSATSGGPWEAVATTSPSQTTYSDANRTGDQQVCYRVIAVSSEDGDSGPSNIDCTSPPLGPTGLVATPTAWSIDLTWKNNSTVAEGYEVQRSDDGFVFWTIAWVSANAQYYSDSWTATNRTYWYRVRGTKDGGFSDHSNTVSAVRTCVPTSSSESVCDDGADDDCDDMIDWDDPDCGVPPCEWVYCSPGYTYSCYDGMCYPHCNNGIQDGDESDVDCGGSCAPCETGWQCWGSWDCASGNCVDNVCQPAPAGDL